MNMNNNMKFENEMELSLRPSASSSKLNSYAEDYLHKNQSQRSRQLKQQEIIQSSSPSSSKWSPEENKMFENALAVHDKDSPDKWVKVAAMIPGKTVSDVMKQYQELEADVGCIEAGLVPLPPGYTTSSSTSTYPPAAAAFTLDYWVNGSQQINSSSSSYNDGFGVLVNGGNTKRLTSFRAGSEHDRKKGVPWTEEEHKLFLLGLKKYGKGDWRNISRNFVITRTPTQVASHAQKYFIRQHSGGKDKRRASIHDITIVDLSDTCTHSPDHLPLGQQQHSAGMPYQWSNSSYGKGSASMDFNNDVYGFNSSMPGQGLHSGGSGMLDSYIGSQSIDAFQMQSGMHYPQI